MANDDQDWEARVSGSSSAAPLEDIWEAARAVCECYVRRDVVPAEKEVSDLFLDMFNRLGDASASPAIDRHQFQERFRAMFKTLQRHLIRDRRHRVHHPTLEGLESRAVLSAGPVLHFGGDHGQQDGGDSPVHPAPDAHLGLRAGGEPQVTFSKPTESSLSSLPEEMTTEEAGAFLGFSRSYVIKLINSGELAARMVGRYRRILTNDLIAYRDKSFSKARAALSDLSHAARAELDARPTTGKRSDEPPPH